MSTVFEERVKNRDAVIGVVGLGYVGLPLLLAYASNGFPVVGMDIDDGKLASLAAGESYIRHIPGSQIREVFDAANSVKLTSDFSAVSGCDAILLCVPTPLTRHREPDLSFVEQTARQIAAYVREGQLISLESTTYPGTTEEILCPILKQGSGLEPGRDFFVAYSPEREDPNNPSHTTATIPKVIGGLTPESLVAAQAVYSAIIEVTVPVSSCRTAEATKLMENIFRCINIALVNELKIVFTEMGIDIWEVVRAASTKPFGFMPFYPGPGLGGHCIPIDPFYLTWKAREFDVATKFIELAGEINTAMPAYVVQRTMVALNALGKPLKGSRVLLVGLAYKKNVDDDRESPTYALWRMFAEHGAELSYYDSYCPVIRPSREHAELAGINSVTWDEVTSGRFDVAVIATAHDNVDHDALAACLPLVVDTRGVCKDSANVTRA